MHIVLAILGAVVTILILVNRLSENGIDIGWLNPFAWKRRKEWSKKYHVNPIYSINSPMEVTALLMVALVKSEGEISSEQKREILKKFVNEFNLNEEQSSELLASSSFLLKDDIHEVKNMSKVLAPSLDSFSNEQAASALSLLKHMANFDNPENSFQKEIISLFNKSFSSISKDNNNWS